MRVSKFQKAFRILALVLSHIMCIVVTYNYMCLVCGGKHEGWSAPAYLAFFEAVPFLIAIGFALGFGGVFRRRR